MTNSTPTPLPTDDLNSEANIQRRQTLRLTERTPDGRLLKGSIMPHAGRPEGSISVTVLARKHTQRAIEVLSQIMDDPGAPGAARATASQALLDRGWGKAPIQIDLTARARFDDFLRDVGRQAEARKALAATTLAAITHDMVDETDADSVD